MSQEQTQICPVVQLVNNRPATTSLKIAECFGKQHAHVMRDIQALIAEIPEDFSQSNFGLAEYKDEQRKPRPMYIVYFDGFMLLVMGYTGKKALAMKLAYIGAFNAMREKLEHGEKKELPFQTDGKAPITSADQNIIQILVNAICDKYPNERKSVYMQVWMRLRTHFGLGSYKQLPQNRMAEAVAYLANMEGNTKKALPPTSKIMDDYAARTKDAAKRVKEKSAQFMDAVFALQDSISVRIEHGQTIPPAARNMANSVRQMATSTGMSVAALTDLAETYCALLAPTSAQSVEKDFEFMNSK